MITEEQRKERTQYVGSSDAAAILGLSRWSTPLQVWAEKTGQLPPKEETLAMEVGNELEELVAKLFTKRAKRPVRRVNETLVHPNYSFIRANIDRRVIGEDAILEAKTCSGWKAHEWEGEEIPREYLIQVQHQLAVTGKERAYVAVLIGGNQDFRWKCVERDNDLIKEIVYAEAEFWTKFVEPKVMPTTVMSGDSDTLAALYPDAVSSDDVILSEYADELAATIKTMQGEAEALGDKIAEAKNKLKAMLGKAEAGATAKWRVTWKRQAKDAYTVPASSTRVLRIREVKQQQTNKEGK